MNNVFYRSLRICFLVIPATKIDFVQKYIFWILEISSCSVRWAKNCSLKYMKLHIIIIPVNTRGSLGRNAIINIKCSYINIGMCRQVGTSDNVAKKNNYSSGLCVPMSNTSIKFLFFQTDFELFVYLRLR